MNSTPTRAYPRTFMRVSSGRESWHFQAVLRRTVRMRLSNRARTFALAFLISLSASAARAITLGQVDDFQDGTTQNWTGSPTANAEDAGPGGAGDNALFVNSDLRVVTFNSNLTQWRGDFTAAGITHISMDVRHQNASDLELRIGIANGIFFQNGLGDTYVSSLSITVPNDNAWHSIVLPILASDFDPNFANNTVPPDAAVALTNVTHFRILHNPSSGDFRGALGSDDFYLDNIRAISNSGDFDNDGDVDGADFLAWQRNTGVGNLSAWEESFGNTGALAATHAVPEPATGLLLLMGVASRLLLRGPKFSM